MDEELERFEEKQKLTNLQIEKRFVDLESLVERLETEIKTLSGTENLSKQLEYLKNEIENLRIEKKNDLEQVAAIAKSFDTSSVIRDFEELRTGFENLRSRFEERIKEIQKMQEDLVGLEERGKLPQCNEKFENFNYEIKNLLHNTEELRKKITVLERMILDRAISQPIILE